MSSGLDSSNVNVSPVFKWSHYLKARHAIIILTALASFALIYLFFDATGKVNSESAGLFGTFGDFFGGTLNPILTFLSVILLIGTISIQQRELALTREDLALTRTEYEKTSEALNTQAIENTFFNILRLHNEIVMHLNFTSGLLLRQKGDGNASNGHAVFDAILNEIKKDNFYYNTPEIIYSNYVKIQKDHNHILGQYFRNLYQALKLIDAYSDDVLPPEKKKKYSSILRAQLSTKELAILFLNCLDDVCDGGQFKNLLIKYAMLEHLSIIKASNNSFRLANDILVSGEMLQQYKEIKVVENTSEEKRYGGAFGKNNAIPADYIAPPF